MTTATLAPKARKKQTQDGTPQVAAQRATVAIPSFDELPDSALVRQSQLVRDPKHPTRPAPLPFSPATSSFDELPDSALVRQSQLVRDPKHPTRPAPLPFSPATLWRKVRDQSFPAPVRLGAAITAWKVGDIRQWLAAQAAA